MTCIVTDAPLGPAVDDYMKNGTHALKGGDVEVVTVQLYVVFAC